MIESIGFVAAVLTTSSSVPQLLKILKTKSAADVSSVMFSLIVSGNILWFTYGLNTGSKPIIYSSVCAILINLITLFAKIKYAGKVLSTSKP